MPHQQKTGGQNMAIDKATLEQYTNAYKFYIDDLKSKNITGEQYNIVEQCYNRMIELGEQCSDMTDYQTKTMNENLYGKISQAYTSAITEYTQKNLRQPSVSGMGATVASSVASTVASSVIGTAASKVPGLNAIPSGVAMEGANLAINKAKGLFSLFKKKKDDNDVESNGDSRQYKTRRT